MQNKTKYNCCTTQPNPTFGDLKEFTYKQQNVRIQVQNIEKYETTQDVQIKNCETQKLQIRKNTMS